MKFVLTVFAVLVLSSSAVYSQSGRRAKEPRIPVPVVDQPANDSQPKPPKDEPAPARTAKNRDYRCLDDGSLVPVLESEAAEPLRRVVAQATITSKPAPSYTKEARRIRIQGFVILKLLLTGESKIARVRVLKALPAGLTENAIRAACKIKFKPAMKDGQPVSRWITAEYLFRLAGSSIFTP